MIIWGRIPARNILPVRHLLPRGSAVARRFASEIQKPADDKAASDLAAQVQSEADKAVYKDMQRRLREQFDNDADYVDMLKEANKPLEIEMRPEHEGLMMQNPLDSPGYLAVDASDATGGRNVALRVADNPKAQAILQTSRFDLADRELDVLDSMQSDLYFSKEGGYKEVSLGNVGVMPSNTMALEDVDLENIPKHIDIALKPDHREVVIVGKEVAEEEGEDGQAAVSPITGRPLEVLDGQIFVEKSEEDARREEMNLVERWLTNQSFLGSLMSTFRYLPLMVFLVFYLQAREEVNQCAKDILAIDEQNVQALNKLKKNAEALRAVRRPV